MKTTEPPVPHATRPRFRIATTLLGIALFSGCAAPRVQPCFTSREQRDRTLRDIVQTRSWTAGRPAAVTVAPEGDAVLFLRSAPRSRAQDLYVFDVAARDTRVLASAATLLGGRDEELSDEERARRERQRVGSTGITGYKLSDSGRHVLITLSGKLHVLDRADGTSRLIEGVEGVTDSRFSPDDRYISYVKDHDLYVCDWQSGQVTQITTGGTDELSHAEAEFVAQEEMGRHTGYWWSPDSTMLVYQETDTREVEKLYIADAAAPNRAPKPWPYPRAGKSNANVRLGLIPLDGGTTTWIEWDAEKFPYLATVRWSKNAPLTILVQDRRQREEVLLRVDHLTGHTYELLRETDPAWINIDQAMPRWLENTPRFLWTTEADGERRLCLHDADGRRLRVLNPDDSFRYRGLVHVDESRGVVIVAGSDQPTQSHLYELSLEGGPAQRLTTEPGNHSRIYARDGRIYIDRFDSLTESSEWTVRTADGTALGLLPSQARRPPFTPRVELTRVGRNNEFDAAIVRPRNFQPGLKYPVIVSVYGGPSGGVVHSSGRGYMMQQWYADQGFIVVSSDNRGVENRGRAWERAIAGNFGHIPLDDQITALRALGARYPELDLGRVGIMGWSFGGYMSALAVCKRGDVFHAAAAGAPVTDWKWYDTHYTERYLGLPEENKEGYRRSSVLTYAKNLRRPLLIIHGTADDNVYFVNSLALTDTLIRAGRPFEFAPLSGYAHGVRDAAMRIRVDSKIAAFFRRHLIDYPPAH